MTTARVRWMALAATVAATVATVAVSSPALAGTSYFPTVSISTGSSQGVNVKAGVYHYDEGLGYQWTKTYATSYGAPNHRVDFALVRDGITSESYYHPNVGTGTWEDCLNGTNTNCIGAHSASPAYLRVTVRNLSNGTCRTSVLSTAAINTDREWSTATAC